MASACCRETAMRLPPRVAQPRPSSVTSTEVRPILRFSKTCIALPLLLSFHTASVRVEDTPFAPWSGGGAWHYVPELCAIPHIQGAYFILALRAQGLDCGP